ncbi:hypothetical protein FBEOM_12151 [Fusarium beomiforme]|uniref:CBM-cenC domain-containing protein n=1 Tax=Fusarium beomiforme TaxID=44412 RepID=A0A9P5A8L6_9HYPO|nr:hypothetical protein FBEOM_12151 [Fusarium beomiforme]
MTSITDLSSSAEIITTSTAAETTTSDAPTTTAAETSAPSGLFLNPSFDEPNDRGDYDGYPLTRSDTVSPGSVGTSSDIAHTGSHSAYWSVTSTSQNGQIKQQVSLGQSQVYTLSYWHYMDEDDQPQALDTCYIGVTQEATDGLTSSFPDFFMLTTPLPLKTWTYHMITFNSVDVSPAIMEISVSCYVNAGSGIKVAIDDIQLSK